MLSRVAALCLALVSLFAVSRSAEAAPVARPAASSSVQAMLRLINADRAGAKLPPLRLGRRLASTAEAHSLDMARRDYFAHNTPNGVSPYDRMDRAGIQFREAGENLGYASGASLPRMLSLIENAMMHSPEHRDNLLRTTFSRVGIGIVVTGDTVYVTEDFKG